MAIKDKEKKLFVSPPRNYAAELKFLLTTLLLLCTIATLFHFIPSSFTILASNLRLCISRISQTHHTPFRLLHTNLSPLLNNTNTINRDYLLSNLQPDVFCHFFSLTTNASPHPPFHLQHKQHCKPTIHSPPLLPAKTSLPLLNHHLTVTITHSLQFLPRRTPPRINHLQSQTSDSTAANLIENAASPRRESDREYCTTVDRPRTHQPPLNHLTAGISFCTGNFFCLDFVFFPLCSTNIH